MTTEETIRSAIDAYDRHDIDAVNALIHDDVTYMINAHDGPYRANCASRDEFWEAVHEILSDWDIASYKMSNLIVSGDQGAAEIDIEMKSRHTGHHMPARLALFLRVKDGQLTEIREYHDTLAVSTSRSTR